MPESFEVETKELQEAIHELHEEQEERHEEEKRTAWTKYIALSTAILAVVAAVGALRSAYFVNEALINQVKAADSWTEYQAARQKDHLYTLMLNNMLDANASNPKLVAAMSAPPPPPPEKENLKQGAPKAKPTFKPKDVVARAVDYRSKIFEEMAKEEARSDKARELEKESEEELHHHHKFEYSVGIIQVAIALSAVAALTRIKPVWAVSLVAGFVGIVLFAMGFLS